METGDSISLNLFDLSWNYPMKRGLFSQWLYIKTEVKFKTVTRPVLIYKKYFLNTIQDVLAFPKKGFYN